MYKLSDEQWLSYRLLSLAPPFVAHFSLEELPAEVFFEVSGHKGPPKDLTQTTDLRIDQVNHSWASK